MNTSFDTRVYQSSEPAEYYKLQAGCLCCTFLMSAVNERLAGNSWCLKN